MFFSDADAFFLKKKLMLTIFWHFVVFFRQHGPFSVSSMCSFLSRAKRVDCWDSPSPSGMEPPQQWDREMNKSNPRLGVLGSSVLVIIVVAISLVLIAIAFWLLLLLILSVWRLLRVLLVLLALLVLILLLVLPLVLIIYSSYILLPSWRCLGEGFQSFTQP